VFGFIINLFANHHATTTVAFRKSFPHPPSPLGRESLLGLLNRKYQMRVFCQYQKWDCENYLFEDYHWKSGIPIWILDLRTTGRSKRNIPLPIFKNEPMGRNNEYLLRIGIRYLHDLKIYD
jgi:hypothetical protein